MAETGQQQQHKHEAEHASYEDVTTAGLPPSSGTIAADGAGARKRRPASPEVVVHSRPQTPSRAHNTSFDDSQSPTKKQRTDNIRVGIEERVRDSNIFTTWHEASSNGSAPTGLTVDVGVACTTETFAQLTTMTPTSASQIEEKHRNGNAGSKPNSKPSSPTPRNRATPVVEIFQSRPKSAESRKGNAARPTGNSSPTAMKPPRELLLTASDSESDASKQTSSKYRRPSTLQVIDKSGSAGTSQPGSSKVDEDLSPKSERESSNSKSIWNIVPARQAAKSRKSYVDDYQADEFSDEADLSVPQKKTRLPKATAKKATGSKGKGRAADADDFSNSETDEPTVASNLAEPYKATKSASATKARNPASAIKAKRIMQRSKSEGNVLSKSKERRKGKGRSSSSSESEDLFATMTASPSKKKRASGKTGSPARRKATPSKPKAPALAPPPIPDDSSDDDLPTLPFSSQPLPQGQSMQAFDLLDIDDIAFVAIPAKRKSVHEGETLLPNAQLHFWWPARVMNRNRKNFTVSPLVDEPTQEITQFCDSSFVIPEENFDFEHLQKLSTRHNPFPKARQAYAAVQEHADGKLYEIPGEAAYVKALSLALKKAKSDEQSGEDAKENDREHTTSLSESELDLIFNEPRTQVESETDDLESDIEVDAVGLGRNKNLWWPCRIIQVNTSRRGLAANMNTRRKPYQVEFFPYQKASLSRGDLRFQHDEDFFTVPLGEIRTRGNTRIPDADLRGILHEMAETAAGRYAADAKRHAYFTSGVSADRLTLKQMMVHGQYEDAQIKQLSDFLVDWALGRRREAISISSQSPFHTLATEEEKIDYVTLVLLPVALELLALKTDPATVERAEERLREAGNNYPSEEEIRIEAHKVAGEDLSASTEWWEDVLNLRNAQAKRNLMKQEIRTELTNEELEAIGEVTRRNKKKISYKE